MKNIRRFTFSLAALLIVSGLATVSPASADHHGSDDTSTNTTSSSGSGSGSSTSTETSDSIEVHNLSAKIKQESETELDAQKQTVKQHTEAERQKACEARKANLTKRMANSISWAKRHKEVIDTAYTRVKAFHDSNNVNVPNYTVLTSEVDAAQNNAQNSIDALQALDVGIDCSSQTVASSVNSFKTAVQTTRDSLKAYRKALISMIEAMKGASTSTPNGTENESTNKTAQ